MMGPETEMRLDEHSARPAISVVLVDGSYRPHFTIIRCLMRQVFPADGFEVLWIEYYDQIKPELQHLVKGDPRIRVIPLGKNGVYHSSYCFNRGIVEARGDLLVIPDADVVVEDNFLATIWKEHQSLDRLVMYIPRLDEPRRSGGFREDLDHLRSRCVLSNPQNYGGCLTARKRWLLSINGYEQHEVFRTGGDHANGLDVYTRFKNLGLPIMWHPSLRLYHPWHPHSPGFQSAYRLQHILIDHRAKNWEALPFQGIDSALNRTVPPELQMQLASESF